MNSNKILQFSSKVFIIKLFIFYLFLINLLFFQLHFIFSSYGGYEKVLWFYILRFDVGI